MDAEVSTVRRGRLDVITGVRFVAALVVFLCHIAIYNFFAPDSAMGGGLKFLFESGGLMGVSFFFMLSGFVLTWSARSGEGYGRFLRRRLCKMYPNHLATFALAMALYAAADTSFLDSVLNVLLLHSWRPEPGGGNGPSWSLSCDLLFYLLFPVLLPLIKRIRADRLLWWAAGVVAVILLLPVVAQVLPETPRFPSSYDGTMLGGVSMYPFWFLLTFPPVRALDFVLGILIARLVLTGRFKVSVAQAGLVALAGYAVSLVVPFNYTLDAVSVIPMALLIGSVALFESRGGVSWLGSPVMRRLGEASFAFYLVHEIVILVVRTAIGWDRHLGLLPGLLAVAIAFSVSLGISFLLYHFVEMPVMRNWAGSRKPAPASGSPAPTPALVDEKPVGSGEHGGGAGKA
ncbi:acyltransferase family protein [Streptomyces albidus (ex Kaewkla and Franco 2022)]|uniref:acyltransferase family protein n=1 Tax=Streptomyces albidus (ex Kaewkla and Franco 2022) TaxID=722709 RepID=UPI0015EF6D22|nr:acyltransferase [Streptomyces albidus (ex Kaewkla and Franco 2022)]